MTGRERVIKVIKLEKPDRIPWMHSVLPAAWDKYGEELKKILRSYPDDFYRLVPVYTGSSGLRTFQYHGGLYSEPGEFTDEWGCTWKKVNPGIAGVVIEHPLEKWESLRDYHFPDPLAYWRFNKPQIKENIYRARKQGKYIEYSGGNLFELMQWLRGYENLMIDILTNPDRIHTLAERIVDYNLKSVQQALNFGIDGVVFSDDWGSQTQLMINPSLWRKLFKPHYKRMFKEVHNAGLYVDFHSDGYIVDIIPDLIEIGVDILNPQFSAIDLKQLQKLTTGKVCIRSDLDRQYILSRGSISEVEMYVKKIIELFGYPRGGLILRGEIGEDVPLENIKTMYKSFLKYGEM